MRASLLNRTAVFAALAAALGGCALQNPPAPADLQQEALPNAAIPTAWKTPGGVAAPVASAWLAGFGDAALNALVSEALVHNADLRVAAARVEQAGGYLKVASAGLLPVVSFLGTATTKSNEASGLEGWVVSASLELDVWGRVRYARAAAEAQSVAAAADFAYARQSLAATVARSWFTAIEAGLLRGLALDVVRSAEALLKVAQDRFRVGIGNEQDVAAARASLASYRDTLRQVELSREQALRALELLLGRYPAAEVAVAQKLAALPPPPPVGMPSEILERRPDVIAAERRVAAAFNRIGEAKAAMLPRISLTAGGSDVSSDLFLLKNQSNPIWSVGANLLAPLYQGGALRANVEIRTSEQKQAVAEYARAGQKAFNEVENALSAEAALRDRAALLDDSVRDNERAFELVQIQYRVGSVDLREVEARQLALYSARVLRLRVQSEQLAQRVGLHLALGGSFEAPAPTASTR
jgi:NodT family efflux transporter outer membrane factor (OMF) lipoprotein